MRKILWTVIIAFTLSALPIRGTAFAGQVKQGKHALTKSVKQAKHAKHVHKLVKKLHKQGMLAKAGKLGRKKA